MNARTRFKRRIESRRQPSRQLRRLIARASNRYWRALIKRGFSGVRDFFTGYGFK